MIELTGVTKSYPPPWYRREAPVTALAGIDLRIEEGAALAVVGLNGAGKSTLLRALLGYVRLTAGDVRVDGMPARRYVERHGVAYVPEGVAIPGHRTTRETLRAYAMLANLDDDAWDRVDTVLQRLGLGELAARPVRTLSRGNLQRLAIAQALLAPRRVMVLDEPTNALDPVWIARLRLLLEEWRREDSRRILVLTSHYLSEVERLSDRVVLLHEGRLQGELRLDSSGSSLERTFLSRLAELEEGDS
jgi:ABC-2 type transport system ATP-binding protein